MEEMADVAVCYASACNCFWTALALFYSITSCYCYNEKPEECAESQNKKCCRVIALLLACDQK